MKIQIEKKIYESITLTSDQIELIAIEYLKNLLLPGEFISPDGNRLMVQDEHRHGSISYSDVGAATANQNAAYDMLMHIRDGKKLKAKLAYVSERCIQKG